MTLLLLSLAGGVGAATRFLVDALVTRHHRLRLPVGTFVINVTGSLLLGLLVGWAARTGSGSGADDVKAVLGTGFCGGYTTFSTASVEAVRLWVGEGRRRGLLYALATLVVGVGAAAVGVALGGRL